MKMNQVKQLTAAALVGVMLFSECMSGERVRAEETGENVVMEEVEDVTEAECESELASEIELETETETTYIADDAASETEESDTEITFTYTVLDEEEKTIEITGFEGTEAGDLTIPEKIDGYTVTRIGDYAFYGCDGFTGSLTLPDSITKIENAAFAYCTGITGSLIIPEGVTEIGDMAFRGCSGFTENLTIPDSVTEIGEYAFEDCSGFTGSLTIPEGVTAIEFATFEGCSGFTGSLTIPDSVTEIGEYAFRGCSGFTGNLTLSDNLISIGDRAFYGCSGFTGSLIIPKNVISIGEYAFYEIGVEEILVTDGNTTYQSYDGVLYTISGEELIVCPAGKTGTVEILQGVLYIDDAAFSACSSLTGSLILPDSVTSIGEGAFYECSGFTGSLMLPESITEIEGCAFCECSGFTGSLTIPEGVIEIGNYAFQSCSGFTGSLTISDGVEKIGIQAFLGCNGFTGSLTIPKSVISIGDLAFCEIGVEEILVADGNTTYQSYDGILYTISGEELIVCPAGKTGTVKILQGVTYINSESFTGCSGLTGSLIMPNSISEIGEYAFFWGCASITDIYYAGSEEEWAEITICDGNYELTNATIHYNSNGPELIAEIEAAEDGDTVTAELSDTTELSADVLEALLAIAEEKDVTLEITLEDSDSDSEYVWSINSADISSGEITESVDLSVTRNTVEEGELSSETITELTEDREAEQIAFGQDGAYGFTGALTLSVPENAVSWMPSGSETSVTADKAVLLQISEDDAAGGSSAGTLQMTGSSAFTDGKMTFTISTGAAGAIVYGVNGDTDGDGKIALVDLMQILHQYSGRSDLNQAQLGFADIDSNGKVGLDDLMRELHYYSGRSSVLY